ncbi:MAG TPA: HD-GYP domain-containing protein [Clostridia bacterium]
MRLVALEQIRGSETAASNITDLNGRLLLSKGTRIKLGYMNRLSEIGVTHLYIEDKLSEGIETEDLLCEQTRQITKIVLENEMRRYAKGKEFDLQMVQKVSSVILNEILQNRVELINLKDIKLKDEYIFSHCVNVCALSVFLCSKTGMDHGKILSTGAGALLHDFGKMLIPNEILKGNEKLSKEELEEVKKHPKYGYEAMKNDVGISPTTKVVVYMHHERVDGTGYPNGLTGDKIHESAKICSICNCYDSMTSNRTYRKAFSVSDTVEYLYCTAGIYFDKKLVNEFLKYIPIYPAGTTVLLNNGIVGIVVKNNVDSTIRPVVRLLYNPRTRTKYNNREVNLMQELTLKIEKEISFDGEEL